MSLFCIPAGTYLTNVSSTPVIGPVMRDLLSPLVDLSYWTWRNPQWLKIDSNFSGNQMTSAKYAGRVPSGRQAHSATYFQIKVC
jgi:hypothetical protein